MEDNEKRLFIKEIEKIENEFEYLYKKSKEQRKHGRNFIHERLKSYINNIKALIEGEDCEYFEKRRCILLNDVCDVINKSQCPVRLKQQKNEEEHVNIQLNSSVFIKVTKTKKIKKEGDDSKLEEI